MTVLQVISGPSLVSMRDIPRMLRNIANGIEAGKYGEVDRGVLVLRADGRYPAVFGLGNTDKHSMYTDLHAATCEVIRMEPNSGYEADGEPAAS